SPQCARDRTGLRNETEAGPVDRGECARLPPLGHPRGLRLQASLQRLHWVEARCVHGRLLNRPRSSWFGQLLPTEIAPLQVRQAAISSKSLPSRNSPLWAAVSIGRARNVMRGAAFAREIFG